MRHRPNITGRRHRQPGARGHPLGLRWDGAAGHPLNGATTGAQTGAIMVAAGRIAGRMAITAAVAAGMGGVIGKALQAGWPTERRPPLFAGSAFGSACSHRRL